jgi:regulator of sigma E protease
MLETPPVWFILVAFICAIGPLVFFHELGHYLVGRLFGVGPMAEARGGRSAGCRLAVTFALSGT